MKDISKITSYFFKPRIGKYYKDGFKGYKTLVLGVKHHCTLNKCEYYQKCVIERGCRDYDKLCPCYVNMEDQSYYCLSNSNTIEIDSYIEENDKYPKYSLFTEAMMGIDDDITKKEKEDLGTNISKIARKSMVENIDRGVLTPKVQINISTGSNISRAYLYSQ